MKAILTALTLLAASTARAEEKTYSLTLTAPEVDIIGKSLVEQPYKIVAPVFDKLKKQVEDQNKPPVEAPKEPAN